MAPTPIMPMAMSGVADKIGDYDHESRAAVLRRSTIIAIIAFLTLIDLFGSQALLPTLVDTYQVTPAAMGFAVNATTLGMAGASLFVAVFARRIDRRRGIWVSLALLSLPTAGLAATDSLTVFTLLRILQGVFMATAFTLTLTYLSEVCSVTAVGGAMAAYITGNVASNLIGRLMASEIAGSFGLNESFLAFALLNLVGAVVARAYIRSAPPDPAAQGHPMPSGSVLAAWGRHLSDPRLRNTFIIGFLLLFVFVATFTYANFVIAMPPHNLPQTRIGLVYFVFLPAMFTTPLAAFATARFGARRSFAVSMVASILGLGLIATPWLPLVLLGLALIGAGLFFGQSVATGFVGRTAIGDKAAANGLYLASYYLGGIAGALVLGQIYDSSGWTVAVLVLAGLTGCAALLGRCMDD